MGIKSLERNVKFPNMARNKADSGLISSTTIHVAQAGQTNNAGLRGEGIMTSFSWNASQDHGI